MTPLLLIGGGGHCRSCIDVIEANGRFEIAGIVQPLADGTRPIFGYPILGGDDGLPVILPRYRNALVTVGQISSPALRIRLFELVKQLGATMPVIVAPTAYVSGHSVIEEGSIVMHGAIVNAGVRIGSNVIVNSLALIEHDTSIADHCHISTGARINGGAVVGSGCFIGSGAILREGVHIGSRSVIGAGLVVLHDVPAETMLRGKQ